MDGLEFGEFHSCADGGIRHAHRRRVSWRSEAGIRKEYVWNLGTEWWDCGIGIGNATIWETGAHVQRVEVLRLSVRGKHGARWSSVSWEKGERILVAGSGGVRAKARVRRKETNIARTRTVDGIM